MACVWLPQLALRAELLRHPAWDGRPLVLAAPPGQRKEVQLASPEAESLGIRPGLPLREVLAYTPDAIIVQPDPVRTAALVDDLLTALQPVVPAAEVDGETMHLDIAGLRRLYRDDLVALITAIQAAVPPLLHPRIGVAAGKFAAAVAARTARPHGWQVVPRPDTAAFLAPLPATLLPLAPDVSRHLDLLGLRRIGDLAALPFTAVQAQYGTAGARAWRLAHGQDDEPIVALAPPRVVRTFARYEEPLGSEPMVLVALEALLAEAFANPLLQGRAARQARLRALLADSTSWERTYTFKEAVMDRTAAVRQLRAKLALPGGLPPAPIDELALELIGLGGEAARQGLLFTARSHQHGQIAEAARHLRTRYGRLPLHHFVRVEARSHYFEHRWALVPCDV